MGVNKFDGLFRGARAQGVPVAVRNVSKCFGDTQVLQDFTLDIPAGQFLTVIGRSGCGKSTLLRLLAGLETQDSGDLILDGDPHARPARLARVMFQEPRLLPWASVIDNVDVGLGSAPRTPGAEHDVRNNLEAVGLETRADDRPAVLSGGQKQRVAIARALVSRPRILAFDEPLGALDALTRIEMQALLEKVWMEQRFTAILVTHDVSEALALGDRVVLIEGGRIALDLEVRLPRPRRRGSVELATLEERILNRLLGVGKPQPDYVI